MRILKPISINPIKEKELYEFIEERGTKKAVTFLFNFYQNNNDLVQNIVDRLKEMNFTTSKTVVKQKLNDFQIDNDSDDMLSGFIK